MGPEGLFFAFKKKHYEIKLKYYIEKSSTYKINDFNFYITLISALNCAQFSQIRSVNWVSTFAPCNGRVLAGAARCSPLAPFDNRMYITVGLAVGGSLGGCCGVANYNAFDGPGVEMAVKSVTVWYI